MERKNNGYEDALYNSCTVKEKKKEKIDFYEQVQGAPCVNLLL